MLEMTGDGYSGCATAADRVPEPTPPCWSATVADFNRLHAHGKTSFVEVGPTRGPPHNRLAAGALSVEAQEQSPTGSRNEPE